MFSTSHYPLPRSSAGGRRVDQPYPRCATAYFYNKPHRYTVANTDMMWTLRRKGGVRHFPWLVSRSTSNFVIIYRYYVQIGVVHRKYV